MMQIAFKLQGRDEKKVIDNELVIGRPKAGVLINLDLTPDDRVSRPHARIWLESGRYWIEDLGSTHGTQVNDTQIKGGGKRQLRTGDTLRIGNTLVHVELTLPEPAEESKQPAERPPAQAPLVIGQAVDASVPTFTSFTSDPSETNRRLALLCELPRDFSEGKDLDSLAHKVVRRLLDVLVGAARSAFLLRDPKDQLLLKAYLPAGQPAVSETLARQAMAQGQGFIWRRGDDLVVPGSALLSQIETGMYAPLIWQGQALGAVCVDNPQRDSAFTGDDLCLFLAVTHHAALAVANYQLQQRLEREAATKANLLRHFSPQVAQRLMSHRGRVRLGGSRSEVTILCSDIRGFTRLTKDMEPDDVLELLNEYFSLLIPITFDHGGTVDKYAGDAVMVVFGSPEPDPDHHRQAVRAAWQMQAALKELNARRTARGEITFEMGIGVQCGEVVHGFMGSAERMQFTVIGDAANIASRYCDGAAAGEVLISPEVYQRVWKIVKAEERSIATKHEGMLQAYRVTKVEA